MNLSKDFKNNIIIIVGALFLEIPVYFLYFSSRGTLLGNALGSSIVFAYIILAPIVSFVISFKITKTNKLLSAFLIGLGTFILLVALFFRLSTTFEP